MHKQKFIPLACLEPTKKFSMVVVVGGLGVGGGVESNFSVYGVYIGTPPLPHPVNLFPTSKVRRVQNIQCVTAVFILCRLAKRIRILILLTHVMSRTLSLLGNIWTSSLLFCIILMPKGPFIYCKTSCVTKKDFIPSKNCLC